LLYLEHLSGLAVKCNVKITSRAASHVGL